MAKAAKKASSTKKAGKKPRKVPEGEHIRQLAPPTAVRSYMKELLATKSRNGQANQLLSAAAKRANDQGVNVPMVTIMARIYKMALTDPMKGRVAWEDLRYYLEEVSDFDKIAPPGMFSAEEGGQKHRRKSKQGEMELGDQAPAGAPAETTTDVSQQASNGGGEERQTIQ